MTLLAAFASPKSLYADWTLPAAELSYDSSCISGACTSSFGQVRFTASPSDCAGGCTVSYLTTYWSNACGYSGADVTSLKLHVASDPCGVADAGIDLLSGSSFTFTSQQWQDMFNGETYVVVADLDGVVDQARRYVEKAISRVPAVSEWGILIMTVSLLIVGTLLIRQRNATSA